MQVFYDPLAAKFPKNHNGLGHWVERRVDAVDQEVLSGILTDTADLDQSASGDLWSSVRQIVQPLICDQAIIEPDTSMSYCVKLARDEKIFITLKAVGPLDFAVCTPAAF